MIYPCNYEIIHTLQLTDVDNNAEVGEDDIATAATYAEYTIYRGSERIYKARVYGFTADAQTVDIDISPIIREHLSVNYEELLRQTYTEALTITQLPPPSIATFTVRNANGNTILGEYTVKYDYNSDYISELSDFNGQNAAISSAIDPRQYIPLSTYTISTPIGYIYYINDEEVERIESRERGQIELGMINASLLGLSPGDRVSAGYIIADSILHDFTVVEPCKNRYVLYYTNEYGGMDFILCNGRYIESYNTANTDVRLYNDRRDRLDWEQKRILSETRRRWQLNILHIRNEDSANIKHLIATTRAWIHDLNAGTITSCIILDTSQSVKQFHYDGMFSYTINVEESQVIIRK